MGGVPLVMVRPDAFLVAERCRPYGFGVSEGPVFEVSFVSTGISEAAGGFPDLGSKMPKWIVPARFGLLWTVLFP